VLRFYENRSPKHVQFEVELSSFLRGSDYPVPSVLKNRSGSFISEYKGKPYIMVDFIEGTHGKNPNEVFDSLEAAEVIKAVARLHDLTKDRRLEYSEYRQVCDIAYCGRAFQNKHQRLLGSEKGRWFKNQLEGLEFPTLLPKALCHADLNYGNFLFRDGKIVAVLDFDMSFYWYLIYDLASLIYWWAWPPGKSFKEAEAAQIVTEYSKCRKLSAVEGAHIYDALKLIILLGISWSDEVDFEGEKAKIELLNSMGRKDFLRRREIDWIHSP